MSRTKGTFTLTSNIEPKVGAPLDARTIVKLKTDLTANGTFEYPYIGLTVFVTEENKKYTLIGADPTVAANWREEGSGTTTTADHVTYDNTESGLDSTNVQDAIDEIAGDIDSLGTAAEKDYTDQVTEDSTDLITSGAVYDALENLPSEDTKVTQTATTTNANYEILFSETADNTTRTEGAGKAATLRFNPSKAALMEGNNTVASGNYSHAEGSGTTANDDYAHAEGYNTSAVGLASHVEGYNSIAAHNYTHAEGYYTCANGVKSHAEGEGSVASARAAHAEGLESTASGIASHSEGYRGLASGNGAHAEGGYASAGDLGTFATGENAHAEGYRTTANGKASHASGTGTCAAGNNQTVIGQYNVSDVTSLFIIGNGTANNARSNAMAVSSAGDLSITSINGVTVGNNPKFTDENTTYSLTQDQSDGHKITLTPSSGSAQTLTIPDNNTTYTFESGTNSFKVTPDGGTAQTVNVTPSIADATQSASGLMSAADKTKIDGITSGANKVEASTTNGNIKIDGTETNVYTHPGTGTNPHGTTKSDVGLGNVDNTSDATKKTNFTGSIASGNSGFVTGGDAYTALGNKLDSSLKGANNGVAELDSTGKVPSSQLPSFVDDVIEVDDYAHLPTTGESGKIYVTKDDNKTYRWSGTAYVEISPSLTLGETSSTAYRGDRGKAAYDHASETKLSTATASGLYKIAATAQGHIAGLTAVQKSDITALGIPGSDTNTTYSLTQDSSDGHKITLTPSSGTAQTLTIPDNDRYVNSAAFADDTTNNANSPVKMTLTRAGSDTATVTANIPKVSSSGAGVVPKGAAVSTQSQTTKFLREDGTWAAPSYSSNTDEKVKQSPSTTNSAFEVLFSGTADNTERTEGAKKTTTLRFNPSLGALMEGNGTVALGTNSHAEGHNTTAKGDFSHAEGDETYADYDGAHAEGVWTSATMPCSHAEGTGTLASSSNSHAEGDNTIASGSASHAEGKSTTASGQYAHAEGNTTSASGYYAHAEGHNTKATGQDAHAEGFKTTASGKGAHAEGGYTTASSGGGNLASGENAHAEGFGTTASNRYVHSEGYFTIASGDYGAHAEGYYTTASGNYSHAEGGKTVVTKSYAHAEGAYTSAFGQASHAEGSGTSASGIYSHAEGSSTVASGESSHAEGYKTRASAAYSHASGSFTSAGGESQFVIGTYNIADTTSLFIIGNGTASGRSNAMTVDATGNLTITKINGVTVGNDPKFTDNNTTYTFAGGANKITVTPSGGTAQDVNITVSDSTKVAKAGDTMTGSLQIGSSAQNTLPTVGLKVHDVRNTTIKSNLIDRAVNFLFANGTTNTPSADWWSIMHVQGWNASESYNAWEIAGPATTGDQRTTPLYLRTSNGNVWGSWRQMYDSSNKPDGVKDIGNSTNTTFAYSKAGLNYSDYTWLAAWNGYELRAVNKSQFVSTTTDYSLFETKQVKVDYQNWADTNSVIHKNGRESVVFGRFFSSEDSNYANYHYPCVDSHIITFTIDDGRQHFGSIAQDIRTHDLYIGGKDNNTWRSWRKVADSGNVTTGDANGQIKIAGTNVSVKGLGSAAYTASTAYAASSHTHSADDIVGGYLNIQPENGPTLIPFINNDIAFLAKRGGSYTITYDGTAQSINLDGCFDGTPSYGYAIGNCGDYTTIVIELSLHKVFSWTNTIYVDFGSASWRAKGVKIEVMNTNYSSDTWSQKYNNTNNGSGHCYVITSHTPVGASNAGGGFNKIRFTFTSFAHGTIFRIAQMGVYNYSSSGLAETYLNKGGGTMFGGISPYANNSYDIGGTNNKYANVYATNFVGNASSATTATTATTARKVADATIRPASASTQVADGGLHYYLSSGSMTTAKPPYGDGAIIHMAWDNSGGYDSQLYISHGAANYAYVRSQNASTWSSWMPVGVFTQATPTTGQVVVTDGTYGGIKASGYTIAKSVPSNAVFTDTTYTVATGDANGQIKVTSAGGTAYNVDVKGLGSNAYTSTAYLPLAGGTMTGDIIFNKTGATDLTQVQMKCGVNDYGRIAAGATASNSGWMEIATADDANEPIYVRQYSGVYATLQRTATLLDASGNTSFPKKLTNKISNNYMTGTGYPAEDKGSSADPRYFPARWSFNFGQNPSDGDVIYVKLPCAGHDWGDFISTDNGTTYKPVALWGQGTGRMTTHYGNGSYMEFVYDANGQVNDVMAAAGANARSNITGGCWRVVNFYDTNSNNYDRNQYTGTIKCGSTAIVAGNIIVGKDGVYHHLKDGTAFDISYPILYANGAIAANATSTNNYDTLHITITTTQSISLTAYKPVYIKGTLAGKIFTPDSTTPLTQTEPTSADSKFYLFLGMAANTTTMYMDEEHKIFQYINGAFQEVTSSSAYLPLSGGTMTGTINGKVNSVEWNFRPGHDSYNATVAYETSGNEALVFGTKNAVTSFMFVNGEDNVTNVSDARWRSLTPGLQIKNNCVAINYLWNHDVTPDYRLRVNGGGFFNGNVIVSDVLGIQQTGGTSGGVSLYNGTSGLAEYGIMFRKTSNQGTHGYVTSDWATYFTMSNTNNRGWVFRRYGSGNVASIDTNGRMVLNGSMTVGSTSAGGCVQYNSTNKTIEFIVT